MAVERVGVDRDLRVERDDLAALRDEQRVDLDEHRVLGDERLVELREHRADRPDDVLGDARLVEQLPRVEVGEADQRVDVRHPHRLGVLLGDLLDVHAAHPREHHHRLLGAAVEDDRGVVLLVDLGGLLDVELVDREAADVHAEDVLSVLLRLLAAVRELDPARLAAPADQHLRLDDARVAERLGGLDGLLHGGGGPPLGHGDAVLGEKLLSLVLE